MKKYFLMCAQYNPYIGEKEHQIVDEIPEYNGYIDWSYILDCAREWAEYDIHWETDPKSSDTEAWLVVGEVHNATYNGFTIEDHHTITEEHYYIIEKEIEE